MSQNDTTGISPLIKNFPYFDVALLHPPGVDCPPFPLKLYGKLWGWERILPNSQKFTLLAPEKSPLID